MLEERVPCIETSALKSRTVQILLVSTGQDYSHCSKDSGACAGFFRVAGGREEFLSIVNEVEYSAITTDL